MNRVVNYTVIATLLTNKNADIIPDNVDYKINQKQFHWGENRIINLWQFIRSYTIGGVSIPVIGCIYFFLAVANSFYFHYNRGYVLYFVCALVLVYGIVTMG